MSDDDSPPVQPDGGPDEEQLAALAEHGEFPLDVSGDAHAESNGLDVDTPEGRLSFEVYVDRKIRTHSGLMAPTDDFRLLVADDLDGAKELRLVVRPLTLPSYPLNVFWWDPAFYK